MASRDLTKLNRQIWRELRTIEDATVRKMLQNYKLALDEIRVELSKVYEKYAKAGVLTHAEMAKYNRLKSLHDQLTGTLGATFSKNGRLTDHLREVQYEESFFRNAWALDQHTGVELSWGLLNEKAVKASINAQEWREFYDVALKTLRQDAVARMHRVVNQGLIRGHSYEKMARALKQDVLEKSAWRAQRIVQTEAHRAAILGQLDSYDEARDMGIQMHRYWDATLDSQTRPEHGALDGQVAEEDTNLFRTSWGLIRGPGLSGIDEFDINCRCSVTERVDDIPPKYRRVRDEGVVPYKTYDEWAKERGSK